ncbi:MAG TPA: hypothetical protein PLI09_16690 [Candidatus Hydrogenedentes bacterium]|nr:hypothetical protein [Candidatus Hydrogenedentota bacterium]
MKADPILKEVYRMKDEFAREIGNDAGRLCAFLRESAKNHPERIVNLQLQKNKHNCTRPASKNA